MNGKPLSQAPPIVSVVMPVFNAAKYLGQAIESILVQTFQDFELICVDDGSTDNSLELLHAYASRDVRIRVLRNERNLGTSATRNAGMAVARGEYIAVQDADDVSLPTRLDRQVAYLRAAPAVGVLGAAMLVVDERGAPLKQWPVFETEVVMRCLLLISDPIPQPTVMMRRHIVELLGGYRNDLQVSQDYQLWVRAASICRLANLPDILVRYRQTPMQLSSRRDISRREHLEVSLLALKTLAGEANLTVRQIQAMSDLACRHWSEMSPRSVVDAGEMACSIMCRCLTRWEANTEEQRTVRRWLSVQMMRVAGSMFRSGVRETVKVCLPAALRIAPENRGGVEDIWLRLQDAIGPYLARNLTEWMRTSRRLIIIGNKTIQNEESWSS